MGPRAPVIGRRGFLSSTAAALTACGKPPPARWTGGWVGDAPERGHRLRDAAALPAPTVRRKAGLVIVGAGIGGLAAARAARRAGIDDIALFDLHDAPGGNSRGHMLAGLPCPLGAHYLPLPGQAAREVAEWLHEIGVARHELGRTVYDERQLCHSPQERLFVDGAWHDGLLPPAEPGSATLAQYRRFGVRVGAAQRELGFALPSHRAPWTPAHAALDALPFAQWLAAEGLDDARLRWYLDYCCRDDYGAGVDVVSAWAGLHYFASRHGFAAPGDAEAEREGLLTWPEGNARLVQHLAAPLGERWHAGCVVTRVTVDRHAASVDLWNEAAQRAERWTAPHVVLALPLFVAARIVADPPEALRRAAATLRYAPWLVANLHLDQPLLDRPGAAPSWDNVVYGSAGLGYVNAQHQSLSPVPGTTVLTAYRALGVEQRAALLDRPWHHWAQAVIDDLATTHPDLPGKCKHVDLARHGHAMSIPQPGVRGHAALRALREGTTPRLHFAHGDLAGYSVFEEAFSAGHDAGHAAARALRGR
ncbi:MAG TPA: NAD(P)-binding protein [Burkholderiaceae bacterium]|nr:NAD(P)-binding protein [Burkholderiaceae bacterium]